MLRWCTSGEEGRLHGIDKWGPLKETIVEWHGGSTPKAQATENDAAATLSNCNFWVEEPQLLLGALISALSFGATRGYAEGQRVYIALSSPD